jgi:signal transduction histidine kinase
MNKSDSCSDTELHMHRCIIDTVPGLVVEIDENLIITLANRETHKRWGGIIEGKTPIYELFSNGTGKPEDGIIYQTFKLKKNQYGEIETKEGEVFKIITNYIKTGDSQKTVVLMFDITGHVNLEKELEKAKEEAEKHQDQLLQADKMISLGILASGMAHEINNPNNSIMLNVSVLQKAWDSIIPILNEFYPDKEDLRIGGVKYEKMKRKMPQLFSGILGSSKKIQRIVKDLKYFSGKDLISLKSQVDLESVVKSAISLTTNMIHKSTRNFKAVYEKNLPYVMGNFQNLEQVIINLIQNACLALESPDNGIFITITYDRKNREIVAAVKDEGIGIPKKDLKYISEPFFTSKRTSGGTGLGLYVSSKIVNDHGGTIHFFSEPGKGTTVEVCFPALDVMAN